ncbi:acetyl-CoA hydrolase/transferase family protein [Chloroflexota bacterium]
MSAKEVTASEAIKHIKSGDTVYLADTAGEPEVLVEALMADKDRFKGLTIIGGHTLGKAPYAQKNVKKHFNFFTIMTGVDTRGPVNDGTADYIPVRLFDIPRLFAPDGPWPLDVALITVSPPDESGFCSLGVTVNYTLDAALNARMVIAEVNNQMPRTQGNCLLHVDQLDFMVHSDRQLLQLVTPKIDEKAKAIANHVCQLVPDGATLQFGTGAVPESLIGLLTDKRRLGIHTGMLSDGIVDLMQSGAVTNSEKPINQGKIVATVIWGTDKLYRWVDNNPLLEMHPVSYTHDPRVMAQLPNFIAINSAIEVDLTGQVNAESIGNMQVSGVAGQADWTGGAKLSLEGKSIITLPSTAQGGKLSRIVNHLGLGSVVTTPRYDATYIVTEYGIAELFGKTRRQRAEALTAIAHPDFRDSLWQSRFD